MRFFRFGSSGEERPGAFDMAGVPRDISALIDDLGGKNLDPAHLRAFHEHDLSTQPAIDKDVRLGPCVARVGHFIAVGLNYADHAEEAGAPIPTEPILFNKAPSCIVGANDAVRLPPGSAKADWEVELAVVIGRPVWQVAEDRAADYIAGYCICNDVSERQYQLEQGGQWMKGKGCPTFGPLGPWLVTPDEIRDVQSLEMRLDLNGERVQSGSTETMIFGVHYLVSYISRFMQLEPGDVITTGTPPGVGIGMKPSRYLKPGDVMDVAIEGLGVQRQQVTE